MREVGGREKQSREVKTTALHSDPAAATLQSAGNGAHRELRGHFMAPLLVLLERKSDRRWKNQGPAITVHVCKYQLWLMFGFRKLK